jgi:hypothetical protein
MNTRCRPAVRPVAHKATTTMDVVGGQGGPVGVHRVWRTGHQRALDVRVAESDCVSPFVTYGTRHLIECRHVPGVQHHVGFDQGHTVGTGLIPHIIGARDAHVRFCQPTTLMPSGPPARVCGTALVSPPYTIWTPQAAVHFAESAMIS